MVESMWSNITNFITESGGWMGYLNVTDAWGVTKYSKSVAVDSEDNVWVVYYAGTANIGNGVVNVAKFNWKKELQFVKSFNSDTNDYLCSICATGTDVWIGGSSNNITANQEMFITKLDGNGDVVTMKRFGGTGIDKLYEIAPTSTGGCFVTGTTTSVGSSSKAVFIGKFDNDGTLNATFGFKYFEDTGIDVLHTVKEDSLGGCFVAGYTDSLAAERNMFVGKFNNDGTKDATFKCKHFGGADTDEIFSLDIDDNGNCLIGGYTESIDNNKRCFVGKLTPTGIKESNFGFKTFPIGSKSEVHTVINVNNACLFCGETDEDLCLGSVTSTGALDWARKLDSTSTSLETTCSFNGDYYAFCGSWNARPNIGKFSIDGIKDSTDPIVNTITPTLSEWSPTITTWDPTVNSWAITVQNIVASSFTISGITFTSVL